MDEGICKHSMFAKSSTLTSEPVGFVDIVRFTSLDYDSLSHTPVVHWTQCIWPSSCIMVICTSRLLVVTDGMRTLMIVRFSSQVD